MRLHGSSQEVRAFDELIQAVASDVRRYVRELGAQAVGATGVREGVALINAEGRLTWAMGNVDFDSCDQPEGTMPTCPLTLQGYLLHVLGGGPERSTSEAAGHAEEIGRLSRVTALQLVEPVRPGTEIGALSGSTRLFVSGHDEHLAYYGYQHLSAATLVLHMGTYWNLMAPLAQHVSANCTAIRSVPEAGPLAGYQVLVGYRWGDILSHIEDPRLSVGAVPVQRPAWADGDEFVEQVARTSVVREHLPLARQQLRVAARCLLGQGSDSQFPVDVICAGGGTRLPVRLLEEVLPPEWRVNLGPADPTALGVAMLGRG